MTTDAAQDQIMLIDLGFPAEFGMTGSTLFRWVTVIFMIRFIGGIVSLQMAILAVSG